MQASAHRALEEALPTAGNPSPGWPKPTRLRFPRQQPLRALSPRDGHTLSQRGQRLHGKDSRSSHSRVLRHLPAVLVGLQERDNLSTETILEGLLEAVALAPHHPHATVAERRWLSGHAVAAAMAGRRRYTSEGNHRTNGQRCQPCINQCHGAGL